MNSIFMPYTIQLLIKTRLTPIKEIIFQNLENNSDSRCAYDSPLIVLKVRLVELVNWHPYSY